MFVMGAVLKYNTAFKIEKKNVSEIDLLDDMRFVLYFLIVFNCSQLSTNRHAGTKTKIKKG